MVAVDTFYVSVTKVLISVIESAGGGGVLQSVCVSEQEETGGGI